MFSRHTVKPRPTPAAALIAVLAVTLTAATAEAQPAEAQVQAHLAAGEFAPALAIAQGAADPRQRDALLAQIAVAQAQAGAREASLRTVGEISDDRTRSQAISQLASQPIGARGGAAAADFESLMQLIETTVQPDTWEGVGGPGSMDELPTGVYIDPEGVLRPLLKQELTGRLAALHAASAARAANNNARQPSPLRKISLPRLEKQVQLRLAAGQQPTEVMQVLAGLRRIEYVFVYPESGDLVIAGPAGDWKRAGENRIVSTETGQPVVRLDDLVVLLRHAVLGDDPGFGCAITPTQEGLARAKAFADRSNETPIRPSQRRSWLEELRSQLGEQVISVRGLDPRTRAARVMVEADYRMKLVGWGLEEGVPGLKSYLQMIEVPRGEAPPVLGVVRWWFTLNYDAVLAAEDGNAFAIRGQGLKVLSENEKLSAEGKRIRTHDAEETNRRFARAFTEHFAALCEKYPIYAELRNVCDLALAGTLIRRQNLADKAGWHMTCFGDPAAFAVQLGPAPEKVDSVINHRVVHRVHILTGVSGGVTVDPLPLVSPDALERDYRGTLTVGRTRAAVPNDLPREAWWWD